MVIKDDQLQWFTSFLIKKSASLNKSSGSGIVNEPNYQLANELHKPIIRKSKRRKIYSFLTENIWGVDLADIQSLSKYNKGNKYLLCAIDLFRKDAWVVPRKDKKNQYSQCISKNNFRRKKTK